MLLKSSFSFVSPFFIYILLIGCSDISEVFISFIFVTTFFDLYVLFFLCLNNASSCSSISLFLESESELYKNLLNRFLD